MVANPMQKMKRNSILTGLIIGLMIGLILCVIVYVFLSNSSTGSINDGEAITVFVLSKDVKSGTIITPADVTPKVMNKTDIPLDAVSITSNVVSKIDLKAGTILASGMINQTSTTLTSDLREQEYNMISLPSQLAVNDFIDIRLQLPNGGDYIVISKKQILKCTSTTVWLNMYEEEIELMSNAIIEYYIMAGSKLYATKYTDPELQTAAVGTYVPNQTVSSLITSNPNITSYINNQRYSNELKNIRNDYINAAINEYGDNAITNIEENIQEEIETLKEAREAYFGALNAIN